MPMKKKRLPPTSEGRNTAPSSGASTGAQPPRITMQFPPEGKLRFRRIISRAASRPTTKLFSRRLRRMVHCESRLEVEVAELLDTCAGIETFAEQGVMLTYILDGQMCTHVPDFHVTTANRKVIIEAKFTKTISADDLRRTAHLKELLPELGYEYLLVHESHTRKGAYLANTRYLQRRIQRVPSETELAQTMHFVRKESLVLGTVTDTVWMSSVAWMLLKGMLVIAMDEPFAPSTLITLPTSREVTPWVLDIFL